MPLELRTCATWGNGYLAAYAMRRGLASGPRYLHYCDCMEWGHGRKAPAVENAVENFYMNFYWLPVGSNSNKTARPSVSSI